jgi:hypothetical protein
MGGQGGAWGADWDIPNTAALAGPTFSINNNSCNTIPKIKNVNYKLLLKAFSCFLNLRFCQLNDLNDPIRK